MKTFSPFRWKWTRPAFPSRTFPSLSLCLEHHLISFLAHVCLRRGDMEQSWVMFTHCSGVALDNRIPPWVTVVLLSSSRLGGSRPNPVALLAMESVPLVLPWVWAAVPVHAHFVLGNCLRCRLRFSFMTFFSYIQDSLFHGSLSFPNLLLFLPSSLQ